ncbi:hypothetical protein L210DRAFT_3650098 [Boletus edulis BED1]|uniref:Uncharacterized protein n=1 Tax=Boletus edulis BED1 TaxID=1328754 RepID=A0AAD4BKK2_BOLED|nr:hypothetical protein L210DRAFT_3650098 [Boletus edulis BED1]
MPTTYLEAVSPSPSAPPSPDLSSFPSQSWSIIANVDIEQMLTICGDEDLFGMDYVQNSSVPTTPTDSCGPPMLGSSSPTQSPSLTVAEASDEDLSGTIIDIEQISTPVTICGDEDLSDMDYAQRSGVPTTPTDSPMLGSSSPTQSPSLTVAEASDEDLSGTIIDIEQISTPVTICGDEDLSDMDYAQRSGVPTTPTDSPMLGSSSPTQSPSLTVAEASDEDPSGTNVNIEQISTLVMICGDEDLSGMDYAQSPSLTVAEASDEDLSSTNVDIEQISTPVMICGDEDLSGMDYAQRSGVPTAPTDSCGPPALGSSSHPQLSSLTIVEPSPGSANATAESDDACGMGIQTKGSSNDISQTDLSTVTPARNAAASTVPAKVTDNDLATSTTVAASTIMRCHKFGYVPRHPMASSRPFVCSLSMERYAPSKRIRVQKLRLTPSATSRKKQALVPRTVSTKQAFLLSPMLSVFRKAARRRLLSGPETPRPKLSKVVQRRQEGKLVCSYPAAGSATWGSAQVMDVNELPPRPSCVPRSHIDRSSNDNASACEGKQDVTIQVSATSPHTGSSDISHETPSISCRIGMLTKNQSTPVTDPSGMSPSGSPPSSPDLSSLPSQSRRVITDAEVEQTVMPSTGCGDQNLPSTAATPRSGDSSVLTDSCGSSTIGSSPPTQSSPPTVIAPSPSSANTTAGSDGTSKISSPTNGTWAEVSYLTRVPTIISRDTTTCSMAMLASFMDRQVSSFTGISENSHRSRMMVRRTMEISQTFLSSPGCPSQLCPPTTSPKTVGINVSQLRNLFTPKLDKNAKRSISPAMRAEIAILRVPKKVTGGVAVDPRLNRRPPVVSVLKRLGLSGSSSPSSLTLKGQVTLAREW